METSWETFNPSGSRRVVVTKQLPGNEWLEILKSADCRVEICTRSDILPVHEIRDAIGDRCDGAIGQLTEEWGTALFEQLKRAGGSAYSNYAVGYDNVDVDAATKAGIPVGNTPGVLTETTAEMAVALTFAAARRIVEADEFMRGGKYSGWLPTLFLGELLWGKTLGVVGAGRIGAAYARMMVQGHHMNLIYFDIAENERLEADVTGFGNYLESQGEKGVWCRRAENLEELVREADVISLHPVLNEATHHLISADELALMKDDALLVNVSRGPVIDENALVEHCREHPHFRAGLDVFEDEPEMKPGLADLENVTIVPHIASATTWTREGMAILAARNVAAILQGFPAWNLPEIEAFLGEDAPQAAPSIVNADAVGVPIYNEK